MGQILKKQLRQLLVVGVAIAVGTFCARISTAPFAKTMLNVRARHIEQTSVLYPGVWVREQRRHFETFLRDSDLSKLRKQIYQIASATTVRYDVQSAPGRLVYEIQYPGHPYPFLAYRSSLRGVDHIFYRPTIKGKPAAIAAYSLNPSGSTASVSLVTSDTSSVTKLINVSAMRASPTTFVDIDPLTWLGDDKLLYAGQGKILIHNLGQRPERDEVLARVPGIRFEAAVFPRIGHQVLLLGEATRDRRSLYVLNFESRAFYAVCFPNDGIDQVASIGRRLVVVAHRRGPTERIYALSQAGTCLGRHLGPRYSMPISKIYPLGVNAFVEYLDDGDSRIRVSNDIDASQSTQLIFRDGPVSVNQVVPFNGGAFMSLDSWYVEPVWYYFPDLRKPSHIQNLTNIKEEKHWKSLLDIREVLVPSLDGEVQIPITIIKRKGMRTSNSTKTILYAYGANGWLSAPQFQGTLLAWVLDGGVYVQARIRGGGERGYAWHMSAIGFNKIRSAQDIVACAEWLSRNRYGDRAHLGLYGISTGAYIAALTLTHFPGHFAAAVLKSGLYDQTHSGSKEIGDVSDPQERAWVTRRSPLQALKRTGQLPALLLVHGSDDEIYPAQQSRAFLRRALLLGVARPGRSFYMEVPGEGHGRADTYQARVERSFWIQAFFSMFLSRGYQSLKSTKSDDTPRRPAAKRPPRMTRASPKDRVHNSRRR